MVISQLKEKENFKLAFFRIFYLFFRYFSLKMRNYAGKKQREIFFFQKLKIVKKLL
jgi:hypothetical protein